MNCEECKTARINKEGEAWRQHQTIKWLIGVIITLIVLLVGSNCAWMYYENQFEDVAQTVEQDADNGTNNFVGGDIVGNPEGNDNVPKA